MRTPIFLLLLLTLLIMPFLELPAQNTEITTHTITFDPSTVPQWAKDLRRFDIIAFGTFPFTILFTTLGYDLYGRYNPINITGSEYSDILLISAGASLTLALVDLIITVVKRNKEQQRLESIPAGTYEIETLPYGEPEPVPEEPPPN